VQDRRDEGERDQGDEVVARRRPHLVAEEVQRVDVVDPVRRAREVDVAEVREPDRVRVVHEHDERLPEEEGHDREVVAEQTPRGQPDEESDQGGRDDHDRDRDLRLEVVVELRRGEDPVAVGAEAEECDVAEVEKPGEADDGVEPEREQRVDQREDAVPEEVAARRDEGEERGGDDEDPEPAGGRQRVPAPPDEAEWARVAHPARLDRRDPLVDADPRLLRGVRAFRQVDAHVIPSGSPPCRRDRSGGSGSR
jgi:hypothetical protein